MTLGFSITSLDEELDRVTKNNYYIWIDNNNGEDFIKRLQKEIGNNRILNIELLNIYD